MHLTTKNRAAAWHAKPASSVQSYLRMLAQIHQRLDIIESLADGRINLGMRQQNAEAMAYQWQAALQATVTGAFLTDRRALESVSGNFRRRRCAARILRELECTHPGFYPRRAQLRRAEGGELHRYSPQRETFGPKLFELAYDRAASVLDSRFVRDAARTDWFVSSSAGWAEALRTQLASHIVMPIHRDETILIELSSAGEPARHYRVTITSSSSPISAAHGW